MTPAQRRVTQMMQQLQGSAAYDRMRQERQAAQPPRARPAQAPRAKQPEAPRATPAQKMLNVIRRADGGPVVQTQQTTASPMASVVPPQGGLPTLEELMDPNYQAPGTMAVGQRSGPGYEWTTDAFGGMDQRVFDWMAPYVQAGSIVQPVRGAPAQVTVPTTYIPGIDFPATGTAGAGSQTVTPPSGGLNIGQGGIMGIQQPQQLTPEQLRQQQLAQVDPRVTALYQNLLGRDPDVDGGMYWSNLLAQGVPLEEIRQGILGTREGTVAGMYEQYLGRAPEAQGTAYWQNLLAQGVDPGAVAAGIRASQEAQARASASIADVYQSALGRAPEAAGQQYWQDQFTAGASLADIQQGISQSPEAQARQLAQTYQSVLGRAPDAAGQAYWLDTLSRGASMADVQAAIRASEEAQARAR